MPSVKSKKGKEEAVVEETTRKKEDLENHFKETVTRALTKLEVKEEIEKPTMDDQNRTFRTRLVAFWMFSNAGLSVAIDMLNGLPSNNEEEDQKELQKKQNIYFSIILYSTFALALVRFIGVSAFRTDFARHRAHVLLRSACFTSSSATSSGSAAGIRYPHVSPPHRISRSFLCGWKFLSHRTFTTNAVFLSLYVLHVQHSIGPCYPVMVILHPRTKSSGLHHPLTH